MKKEIKERREKTEKLIMSGLGQIFLLKKWLGAYCLPYKEEEIKWSFNSDGYLKSFDVTLDNDAMLKDLEYSQAVPEFIRSGRVTVTVMLRRD